MNGSPLYRATLALCGVLLEELAVEHSHAPLRQRLAEGALRLVDHATLALAGFERRDRLHDLDMELRALRAHLHLAYELGVLEEETFLALAEQADSVGRQTGGWLKKLRQKPERQ